MQKTALILASVLLAITGFGQSQIKALKKHVAVLAHDDMEGRETGTAGEAKAAEYIVSQFEQYGIRPKGDSGFYQFFSRRSLPVGANPHEVNVDSSEMVVITGRNVIGFIDHGAGQTIVIGAHYDHLGYGGSGSLSPKEKAIHNGADDNASGTSVLMELANALKEGPKNNNYLFIAFSGEEKGLWGSNYFTKNPTIPLESINYMINMDMVGMLNEERKLAINGSGTSPIWESTLNDLNKDKFDLVFSKSGVGPSDHTSFYLKNIPVLQFFTGQHKHYHKPSDDVELLNYEGLRDIHVLILDLIKALDDDGKLEFVKTKDESKETPRFKVTLGVIPDYLYDDKGMRIDGVKDDRPASKAGIVDGDIVIRMGGLEVENMMGYMKALSKFESGQTVKVVVKRGQEELTFDVTF